MSGIIHGMCYSKEYSIWNNMKNRCYNKKVPNYSNYGGRGIRVSKSWYNSFVQFYKDMGKVPKGDTSIERINNDIGYCKSNCKWATRTEQNNNRRNNIKVNYKGKDYSIQELADKLGLKYGTLYKRIQEGNPIDGKLNLGGDRRSSNILNRKTR